MPEFKIEKRIVERRVEQLVAEGVEFRFGVDVGVDVDAPSCAPRHDAVVVATGSRVPRDLPVPGARAGGQAVAAWTATSAPPTLTDKSALNELRGCSASVALRVGAAL